VTSTVICPKCGKAEAVVKPVRVHPRKGTPMNPLVWVWGAIGLVILGYAIWMPLFMDATVEQQMLATLFPLAGIIAAIVMIVRYTRARKADWFRCRACGHRWPSVDEAAVARGEARLASGEVRLPLEELPPGAYTPEQLGLSMVDTCIYCGEPATEMIDGAASRSVGERKDAQAWSFNFTFPYCAEHARVSRRNARILSGAFIVGIGIGGLLLVLWFAQDAEAAFRAIMTPLSYAFQQWWVGLIAFICVLGLFCALTGGIVQGAARLLASLFVRTFRDQGFGQILGVSLWVDNQGKYVGLRFSRPETAAAVADLNRAAFQRAVEAAAAKAEAEELAARPVVQVATEQTQAELAATTCTSSRRRERCARTGPSGCRAARPARRSIAKAPRCSR